MSSRTERRLLVVRRRVPEATSERYLELWAELAVIAGASGFHAWRFVSPADAAERLEFLEYEAGSDPREDDGAADVLRRLDVEVSAPHVEEWLEDR